MMDDKRRLKGWKLLLSALFLGPFFLALYFRETRDAYPAARYFAWASLLVMALCAYLMFTFTFSPFIIRIAYLIVFLSIFGLAFFYCWGIDGSTKIRTARGNQKYSLSRAIAWMIVMGIVFLGLNNIIQAIYFWILGEQVLVYFSANANLFVFWIVVGMIYGFVYGIRTGNDYFNRTPGVAAKTIFFVAIFIALYSGIILALVIFPLQRLAPISYHPQAAGFLFYLLLFVAICLSTVHLLQSADRHGTLKAVALFLTGIPLIALHVIMVSAYTVTLNLAIASIYEDRQDISAAKMHYAKAIPYIQYDDLLASLHHRQGVLHVLNQDYEAAIASFKKVLTDYSENYGVFDKARRYMDAFEKNKSQKVLGQKILVVRHRTFEQAASCFPNSLSVVLNFYGEQPISTRTLSYAIKESFSEGTFIWKAESFLGKNGYELLTTYWQRKETLVSLLDAGYPILVYIPGHVYTVYGYDSRMEMFFTYDTAKSNRWDDKPFWNFQRDWMRGSFAMSVVIPNDEREKFHGRFPQLARYRNSYQLWQKAHISDYYESKGNYWKDYDRYALSKSFGLDRLKMNEPYFKYPDFFPFPWDAADWENDVSPVLSQSWARDWSITETYIDYLLYSGQTEQALKVIERYHADMTEQDSYYMVALLESKLAAEVRANDKNAVLSVSDKLIGITGNAQADSYWGHYFKARYLIDTGNLRSAAEILLSALKDLRLDAYRNDRSFGYILDALNEIDRIDPSLIDPEKRPLIEVARIDLASDR